MREAISSIFKRLWWSVTARSRRHRFLNGLSAFFRHPLIVAVLGGLGAILVADFVRRNYQSREARETFASEMVEASQRRRMLAGSFLKRYRENWAKASLDEAWKTYMSSVEEWNARTRGQGELLPKYSGGQLTWKDFERLHNEFFEIHLQLFDLLQIRKDLPSRRRMLDSGVTVGEQWALNNLVRRIELLGCRLGQDFNKDPNRVVYRHQVAMQQLAEIGRWRIMSGGRSESEMGRRLGDYWTGREGELTTAWNEALGNYSKTIPAWSEWVVTAIAGSGAKQLGWYAREDERRAEGFIEEVLGLGDYFGGLERQALDDSSTQTRLDILYRHYLPREHGTWSRFRTGRSAGAQSVSGEHEPTPETAFRIFRARALQDRETNLAKRIEGFHCEITTFGRQLISGIELWEKGLYDRLTP